MKTMNLKKFEVEEIPISEMQNIDGGFLLNLTSTLINAGKFLFGEVVDFCEGFYAGIKPLLK